MSKTFETNDEYTVDDIKRILSIYDKFVMDYRGDDVTIKELGTNQVLTRLKWTGENSIQGEPLYILK